MNPLVDAWLRPLVVGLRLWLGICGGSRVTLHWLLTHIQAPVHTVAALDLDIEEARRALARLKALPPKISCSWRFRERFVALPAGTLTDPL